MSDHPDTQQQTDTAQLTDEPVTSTPPETQKDVSPQPDPLPPDPEAAIKTPEQLQAWENALQTRERRLKALDELKLRGLPPALMDHLDLSSDAALQRGLQLAQAAMRSWDKAPNALPPVPREAPPLLPPNLGYRERAQMYLVDQPGYLEAYRAKNTQQ